MKKIGMIGCGSWGTALALTFKEKNEVTMWGPLAEEIEVLKKDGENKKYLPEYPLTGIKLTSDAEEAIKGKDILIFVIPTKFSRKVLTQLSPLITKEQILISATKGMETGTFKLITEIMDELLPHVPHKMALSGPSHAEEVAQKIPTAVTLASKEAELAAEVQEAFKTDFFRVYTQRDVVGVQIGAAVKNVIAIAAGISQGLGYGSNTLAALMTRGMVEISRLGAHMGGEPATFYGLSGIGDLITTCVSEFSRNHFVGKKLASGMKIEEIESSMTMVAEGVNSAKAVHELASKKGISMPIAEAVYRVLFEKLDARTAVLELMNRPTKSENT